MSFGGRGNHKILIYSFAHTPAVNHFGMGLSEDFYHSLIGDQAGAAQQVNRTAREKVSCLDNYISQKKLHAIPFLSHYAFNTLLSKDPSQALAIS